MGWQGKRVSLLYQTAFHVTTKSCPENVNIALVYYIRGGSRGRVQGVRPPPPPTLTCGFLIQLVFCKKKNYVVYWC